MVSKTELNKKERNKLYQRKYRERTKLKIENGDREAIKKHEMQNESRRKKQRLKREQEKNENAPLVIKTSAPAAKAPKTTRSSLRQSTQNRSVSRESFINGEVTSMIKAIFKKTKDVKAIEKEAAAKYVWFPMPKELNRDENVKDGSLEMTMWYKPTETEFHKWVSVKKSNIVDGGYGLFAERDFEPGDLLTIYLGEYIDPNKKSDYYSIDYEVSPKKIVRLSSLGGYPKQDKLYLGVHMMNDVNWGKKYEDVDRNSGDYNVRFNHDLSVEAIRVIEAGEELMVDYNYDKYK